MNNIDFSLGGLILDYTISSYKGIAVFQLVINGVGGNLAAVQASRISTSLHKDCHTGVQGTLNVCISPFHAFFTKGKFVVKVHIRFKYCELQQGIFVIGGHARTARVLLMMVIPGHLIFSYTISYLQAGHTSFTPIFIMIYLIAAMLQVQ